MRQYFIDQQVQLNENVRLSDEVAHHLINVLRYKENDFIRLVDKNSNVFLAELLFINQDVYAKCIEILDNKKDNKDIICCACMIKKDKWEWLIQKAVELNATKIVPIISQRTIIKNDQEKIERKLERWNKIALEAAQQSNRDKLCLVQRPIKLKDINKYLSEINIVPYEKEDSIKLIDLIEDKSITFIIGPEGGFEQSEIDFLTQLGFVSCSLGSNILRAETASLYTLAVIDAKRS